MKHIIHILFLTFSTVVFSQDTEPNFSLLRQNDDIHHEEKFPNNLKEISFSKNSKISFGGSYRLQAEKFINQEFKDSQTSEKVWLLHRAMVHSNLKVNPNFEAFLELNSSLAQNKDNISPVDKDVLNINQLFIDYKLNENWNTSIGRRNMFLGSGRLVDVREGPNVRLSFDLAEVNYHNKKNHLKAFYSIPVQQKDGVFDNKAFHTDEHFYGLYWTNNLVNKHSIDLYLLHKFEKDKEWTAGTETDKRFSLGLRTFGHNQEIHYNNEFVYQFGSFGNSDINAWTASLNIEKDFKFSQPITIGLKTEAISGDKTINDGKLNTFDGLYPRGAYFGRVAYFGPSNLIDIHPYINSSIKDVAFEFDYSAFWRFSKNDGIYSIPSILNFQPVSTEKFIAHQIGSLVSYPINPLINAELESNVIFPGNFLDNLGKNKPLTHFVGTLELKF